MSLRADSRVRMQVIAMAVILTTVKGTSISRTSFNRRAFEISGSTTHQIYTRMGNLFKGSVKIDSRQQLNIVSKFQ